MQEIFRRPSKDPLPEDPSLEDVGHAAVQAMASLVPGLSNALALILVPPLTQRRDDWLKDLEFRLRELENQVRDFHFDDLHRNEQFVSATLQATQAALRTHQEEKLEALRNAVLNVAVSRGPSEDLQVIFLNLVDSFTPMHLKILRFFYQRDATVLEQMRGQRDLTDQVVHDLDDRGLIQDTRPYIARNRDSSEALVYHQWSVTNLGKQFLAFITSPSNVR